MISLPALAEKVIRNHLQMSPEALDQARCQSPADLHDPFLYKGMGELVRYLNAFKQKQEENPNLILVVDGDYDTDGICASVTLAAALSVFGFRFRIYVPSMAEGYGLSRAAIDNMQKTCITDGEKIGLILTADNGIAAFSGIQYAKRLGITVLVTDHHPAKDRLPDAEVVVDPNQPGDLYPFKGNSGTCVAWKTMLAYASIYQKEALPLIERLIVFAGLSNMADVMPIQDENRYTVTAALKIVKDIRQAGKKGYTAIMDTPYVLYNTAFHGLFDIITQMQEAKDAKRQATGKRKESLPENEELFSWYLSPLLNAPRRVHDTCQEGLYAFLVPDVSTRKNAIAKLIELNEQKSILRDEIVDALPTHLEYPVICANIRKGISGLVAGKLAEKTSLPVIVFAYHQPGGPKVWTEIPGNVILGGSARSTPEYPLNKLIEAANQREPGLLSGGGHKTAAGFSIQSSRYAAFCRMLPELLEEIREEATDSQIPVLQNHIALYLKPDDITAFYQEPGDDDIRIRHAHLDTKTFAGEIKRTVQLFETLRPFGKDFNAETTFSVMLDKELLQTDFDAGFWKTFKCYAFGVEILTFDIPLAERVKECRKNQQPVTAFAKLRINQFRGMITPQIQLLPDA